MKLYIYSLAFLLFIKVTGQNKVEWSENYSMQLQDFENPGSEINPELDSYSISSGTYIEFAMQKNAYSFAFSKNFNSNAIAVFSKSSAVLVAPDSTLAHQLMSFARYSFDLTELYTRKFRKRMFEKKETLSKGDFYQPIFEEINEELGVEHSRVLKLTDLGRREDLLEDEHKKVRDQIFELADYCKSCKPPRKKK